MPPRCTHCSELLDSPVAKFCPRCGQPVPVPVVAPARQDTPINLALRPALIPKLGLVVLAAFILGPLLLIFGIVLGIKSLIYVGTAIMVVLVVLLFLAG